MDNPEYTFQILEVFSKIKTKDIPRELEEYISYVARTGEPVFQWSLVKTLIKEKLLVVLDEFMEGNPNLEIPPCPNVDPFNFETMKSNLLSRLDSFVLPPFTIQRICELLSAPRKEYNRLDKYMRAVEKNVLVVSASDLSMKRAVDGDNDAVINGILYDKVNDTDSLNNVSNHVFSGEETDSELNVSSKLDETDAVQQIIEESWTDDNQDEFKLNGGPSSSTLGVTFENELQFVTDKASQEKNVDDVSNKEDSDSSFGSNSMLLDSSLQNIIGESSTIAFDNVSKSDESFESKNDDTYEFKSDSLCDNELSSTSEAEIETPALDDKCENASLTNDENVTSTVETADSDSAIVKSDENEKDQSEPSVEYLIAAEAKTDDVADECHLDVGKEEAGLDYAKDASKSDKACDDEKMTESEQNPNVHVLGDVQNVAEENLEIDSESCDSSFRDGEPEVNVTSESKSDSICAAESMEVDEVETKFSCGDNEGPQDVEGIAASPANSEIVSETTTTTCEETPSETTE
jgi:serine/threonine-protein phosphatase 4 regulatory subunit 2